MLLKAGAIAPSPLTEALNGNRMIARLCLWLRGLSTHAT